MANGIKTITGGLTGMMVLAVAVIAVLATAAFQRFFPGTAKTLEGDQ